MTSIRRTQRWIIIERGRINSAFASRGAYWARLQDIYPSFDYLIMQVSAGTSSRIAHKANDVSRLNDRADRRDILSFLKMCI
jgi:hypothetical protein